MDGEWAMEIAYEAELNTEECPELLELARELVHEDQDTRGASIDELRALVYERGECSPRRMDDAFLLRFLRARKYVMHRAYKLLVRYCRFLEQYPDLYSGVDLFGLVRVGGAYDGTMYDHPACGRVAIMRLGFWDPNDLPIELLARAVLAMLEIGLRQPKLQILGSSLIIDLEGATATQLSYLNATRLHQMLSFLGVAVPVRVRSCHFINYSWYMSSFFYLFQRYVTPALWKRMYFHGYDLKSLQQHIEPSCLPVRYGGTCTAYHDTFAFWLDKIKKYRDQRFDKEMKEFGYVIKE